VGNICAVRTSLIRNVSTDLVPQVWNVLVDGKNVHCEKWERNEARKERKGMTETEEGPRGGMKDGNEGQGTKGRDKG
jgi:hypothetical protein